MASGRDHPMEMDLRSELLGLEERLNLSYTTRSSTELSALLADDFREFGSSGRIFDKASILRELAAQPDFRIRVLEFEARPVATEAALATYRAEVHNPRSGKVSFSLRSTFWVRRDGVWMALFHQGTRTEAPSSHTTPPVRPAPPSSG